MRAYAAAIWQCRYFWMSLVRMDLRTRYRRSVLGLGWSLLNPIAMTAVLCTVFHNLFKMDIEEYAPFLLSGLTLWNFLQASITQGCDCFYTAETYIRQYPTPLAIHPLRTVLGAAFHFSLSMCVVLVLTWCFQGFGNLPVLYSLVPSLILLFVLGWSLAILTGLAGVFFPDMKHLLEIVLQIVYYISPIMYKAEMLSSGDRGLGWLAEYNPVTWLMALIREPILYGRCPSSSVYGVSLAIVCGVAGLATLALVRLQRRLIFYL
ncbi:MAG TPA: ABC transporter permease [Pirellulales bacterium]|nr:ABC transporter permease [Pirellulales bacterium]